MKGGEQYLLSVERTGQMTLSELREGNSIWFGEVRRDVLEKLELDGE